MKISDIQNYLEEIAPLNLQEDYDNSGLILGEPETRITSALISLDLTDEVMDEACEKGSNLIITHHPIVFHPLKRFNTNNLVERLMMRAIKQDISLYAIHTNLDNVLKNGVNSKIAERLNLTQIEVLAPLTNLHKITVKMPSSQVALSSEFLNDLKRVLSPPASIQPVFYFESSLSNFTQMEVICPSSNLAVSLRQIKKVIHKTEAYIEVSKLENQNTAAGAGLVGYLKEEMEEIQFLYHLKQTMNAQCIRYTQLLGKPIKKVALCGGSGSFLLKNAIKRDAGIFISSDFKYHDFFEADNKIVIADIGHYESEQFTVDLLGEIISEKFPNFAVHLTKTTTNPITYLK